MLLNRTIDLPTRGISLETIIGRLERIAGYQQRHAKVQYDDAVPVVRELVVQPLAVVRRNQVARRLPCGAPPGGVLDLAARRGDGHRALPAVLVAAQQPDVGQLDVRVPAPDPREHEAELAAQQRRPADVQLLVLADRQRRGDVPAVAVGDHQLFDDPRERVAEEVVVGRCNVQLVVAHQRRRLRGDVGVPPAHAVARGEHGQGARIVDEGRRGVLGGVDSGIDAEGLRESPAVVREGDGGAGVDELPLAAGVGAVAEELPGGGVARGEVVGGLKGVGVEAERGGEVQLDGALAVSGEVVVEPLGGVDGLQAVGLFPAGAAAGGVLEGDDARGGRSEAPVGGAAEEADMPELEVRVVASDLGEDEAQGLVQMGGL